jgi:hypothetical protein
MTRDEIIRQKAALDALDRLGRLTEEAIVEHVGLVQCRPLPTVAGKALIQNLIDKDWVGTFKDPVLEVQYYVITANGRVALKAM